MIAVAILRRRLREGRTYDDFREAWYHGVGFGTPNRMLTALNVADPREVIVIALTETAVRPEPVHIGGPCPVRARRGTTLTAPAPARPGCQSAHAGHTAAPPGNGAHRHTMPTVFSIIYPDHETSPTGRRAGRA